MSLRKEMTPELAERYIELMIKYGVQNLQIGEGPDKLVVAGVYKDAQPMTEPEQEPSREELLDRLKE